MQFLLIAVATFALCTSYAQALGVNCRGNTLCDGTLCDLTDIQNEINALDDSTTFTPGQHIACCGDSGVSSGICAFAQSTTQSITAADAKVLIEGLVGHGCKKCGSFPFTGNDVSKGQLTANWVSSK